MGVEEIITGLKGYRTISGIGLGFGRSYLQNPSHKTADSEIGLILFPNLVKFHVNHVAAFILSLPVQVFDRDFAGRTPNRRATALQNK